LSAAWQPVDVPIIRDDGTEDWGLLFRRLTMFLAVVVSVSAVYLAVAWIVVMSTDACWPPWDRVEGHPDLCTSPK
jgi:hypothetical protein